MIASLLLLIAALAMTSGAKRLKPGSGVVIHPITAPFLQHALVANTPVVTLQHLQVQTPSFPTVWSDESKKIFPFPDWSANAMEPFQASSTESGRALPSADINTVQSLKLDSFLGLWYQMYGSPSKANPAFGNAGLISKFELNEDGHTIDITNWGSGTTIFGTTKATDLPGQRKYSFTEFDGKLRPSWLEGESIKAKAGTRVDMRPFLQDKPDLQGDYWIYKLGPIIGGKYEYAIVGSPPTRNLDRDQTQLSVLARSAKRFKSMYSGDVQEWLMQNGFDSMSNKPQATIMGGKSILSRGPR